MPDPSESTNDNNNKANHEDYDDVLALEIDDPESTNSSSAANLESDDPLSELILDESELDSVQDVQKEKLKKTFGSAIDKSFQSPSIITDGQDDCNPYSQENIEPDINFNTFYQAGSEIDNQVLFFKKGTVSFQFEEEDPITYEGKNFYAGLSDLIIDRHKGNDNKRLVTLGVSEDADYTIFPVNDFDTDLKPKLQNYKTGFNTCQLLANLNNHTRHKLSEKIIDKNHSDNISHKMARIICNLVKDLDLPQFSEIKENQELIRAIQSTPTWKMGSILVSEKHLTHVPVKGIQKTPMIKLYSPGTLICKEGDTARELFILLSGSLKISSAGVDITTISKPGEVVGELAMFLDGQRTASMISDEEVQLLTISRQTLEEFHSTHKDFFISICKTLAYRLLDNVEKIDTIYNLDQNLTGKGGKTTAEDITIIKSHLLAYQKSPANPKIKAKINSIVKKYRPAIGE